MGRHAEGWSIQWRPFSAGGDAIGIVRFSLDGVQHSHSTGDSDPKQAAESAKRIYAGCLRGECPTRSGVARTSRAALMLVDELSSFVAEYDETHPTSDTGEVLAAYSEKFVRFFGSRVSDVTASEIERYTNKRLTQVQRTTVRKERSALRRFFEWLLRHEKIAREEIPAIYPIDKSKKGVRSKLVATRKRAPVIFTDVEAEAILAALPEWSAKSTRKKDAPTLACHRFRVRAFYAALWETGLRPSTVQRLRLGIHYRPGRATLFVTGDIDKIAYERELPISDAARAALDRACVGVAEGAVIFGEHDRRKAFKNALAAMRVDITDKILAPGRFVDPVVDARIREAFDGLRILQGLDPEKMKISDYDFRHSRNTHLASIGVDVPGRMYLMGHTQATTTDRYTHTGQRAGQAAIATAEAFARAAVAKALSAALDDAPTEHSSDAAPDDKKDGPAVSVENSRENSGETTDPYRPFPVGARGFEPPTPRPPV